jgi:hypothetical protein
MSRTIQAIERHMVPPSARSERTNVSARATTAVSPRHKLERKLRVVLAPLPLSALGTATK